MNPVIRGLGPLKNGNPWGASQMLKSTGLPIQGEAAQNALRRSNFAALPEAYPGPRVTIGITFFYKERPR